MTLVRGEPAGAPAPGDPAGDDDGLGPLTDDELTALALAAAPDADVADDAVCWWDLFAPGPEPLVADWYMPSPAGGTPRLKGWRRGLAIVIVVAFLAVDAYGLCSTYGPVTFG